MLLIFTITLITFFFILMSGERMALMIYVSVILLTNLMLISMKNFLKIILFNLFLVILFLFLFNNQPDMNARVTSIILKLTNFWQSDYGTVFISSYHKWMQNPFFGSGIHQFVSTEPIYGYGIMEGQKILHAHNYPLNLLVETGLTGLILFYAIIFFIIKEVVSRANRNLSLMIFLITIIYFSYKSELI